MKKKFIMDLEEKTLKEIENGSYFLFMDEYYLKLSDTGNGECECIRLNIFNSRPEYISNEGSMYANKVQLEPCKDNALIMVYLITPDSDVDCKKFEEEAVSVLSNKITELGYSIGDISISGSDSYEGIDRINHIIDFMKYVNIIYIPDDWEKYDDTKIYHDIALYSKTPCIIGGKYENNAEESLSKRLSADDYNTVDIVVLK